jgi:hypothetical protein
MRSQSIILVVRSNSCEVKILTESLAGLKAPAKTVTVWDVLSREEIMFDAPQHQRQLTQMTEEMVQRRMTKPQACFNPDTTPDRAQFLGYDTFIVKTQDATHGIASEQWLASELDSSTRGFFRKWCDCHCQFDR